MRGEEFRQMRYCFCAVNITGPSRITRDTLRKYGIEFQNEKRSVKSGPSPLNLPETMPFEVGEALNIEVDLYRI